MVENTVIGTVCSHSAMQIFHGARLEGFKTVGLTLPQRKEIYQSLPNATPDEFIVMNSFNGLLNPEIQQRLLDENVVIIPHGSFVEYIGAKNILDSFNVPIFGNKKSLIWESSREKVIKWMKSAKLKVPEYLSPDKIDKFCIAKKGGAKGGKGFFLVNSENQLYEKLGSININDLVIQEYIIGVRYYHHFFHSVVKNRTEFLGVDQRLESNVDGLHRIQEYVDPSYNVTGNSPVVLRESLVPKVIEMGKNVVKASQRLFPPGISGPFCIETICTPELEFFAFEISARIVAGTNLYPHGSQYTCYYFHEPMSTGRRIARELKEASELNMLERVLS
ncbi:MAG: formate--phosphoribosylaminoimidazolecarboxamide ligase [Candidatus Hodarchaeales archaeon]|jgi:5-formaminoimidazole-4-carboxamide-1-(beta)-D-ribofuranosyl 5'-monophosphate synthetase